MLPQSSQPDNKKVGELDIMDIFVDLTSICALAAAEGHRWG